jgi:D-erythro-7,8-dihydroneopterin triphosphate epimerase
MAKVRIKNLRLRTIIGTNKAERKNLQDIIVNITLEFDSSKAEISDKIRDATNYRTITKTVIKFIEKSRFYLLEKLCRKILDIIMSDKRIKSAAVEIDKPGALRFADSVSVELTAKRGE